MASQTASFGLGTFRASDGLAFAGLVVDESVHAIDSLPSAGRLAGRSVYDLLQTWDETLATLVEAAASVREGGAAGRPMAELSVAPPVDRPLQIVCAGANYHKHVLDIIASEARASLPEGKTAEDMRRDGERMMRERAETGTPYAWVKAASSMTGAFDPIILPKGVSRPDWELELAVVMGRTARHVSRAEALDYVAGYTIANDITARDFVYREDMKRIGTDWMAAKGRPGFLPIGPYIVPAQFVADPQDLTITLKLNGQAMQDESTSDMIFGTARLIEYISSIVTLHPGDVVCTGSPAGNGAHYGRFLQEGDVVESTITGLGAQRNVCVPEA